MSINLWLRVDCIEDLYVALKDQQDFQLCQQKFAVVKSADRPKLCQVRWTFLDLTRAGWTLIGPLKDLHGYPSTPSAWLWLCESFSCLEGKPWGPRPWWTSPQWGGRAGFPPNWCFDVSVFVPLLGYHRLVEFCSNGLPSGIFSILHTESQSASALGARSHLLLIPSWRARYSQMWIFPHHLHSLAMKMPCHNGITRRCPGICETQQRWSVLD